MVRRSEGYFRGFNDFELFFQAWLPENPTATLVVTHGLGEHSECYQRLVDGLQPLSAEIYVWDLRGHGRSEGKRGFVRKFEDFTEDLHNFLSFLREENQGRPIFLLGHSMGGLINCLTLLKKGNEGLKGAILSSPLLGINVEIPKFKQKGAEYLARWAPKMTMFNEIYFHQLSHEKEILEEFDRDPLRHDRCSPQLYLDMVKFTQIVRNKAKDIDLPILFQVSGADTVVSSNDTKMFYEKISSKDKSFMNYEKSFHEIYNDVERNKAFSDLINWIKKHL